MINKENYQSYLLDKAEGILSKKDNKQLEEFLKQNPELIPSEDEYDCNIKIDDEYGVVYPDFDNLIRPKRRLVPFIIKYTAIAAMITLLITVTTFIFNKGKDKRQSSPIAITIKNNINSKTNTGLAEPLTIMKERVVDVKSSKPITKIENKIEKIEEPVFANTDNQLDYNAAHSTDTIRLVVNNLIEYVEVFESKPKTDTIYIHTNWLCRYEKTPPKQPYQKLQNSIRGILANK